MRGNSKIKNQMAQVSIHVSLKYIKEFTWIARKTGKYAFINGDTYEGEVSNEKPHGYGNKYWND